MKRPPVPMLVQILLLRRPLRTPGQQLLEPLPRIPKVNLGLDPLRRRTFPMIIRGLLANSHLVNPLLRVMLQSLPAFLTVWRVFSGQPLRPYSSEPNEELFETDACRYEGYLGPADSGHLRVSVIPRQIFLWMLLCSTNSYL
jgi:hypothetical protein